VLCGGGLFGPIYCLLPVTNEFGSSSFGFSEEKLKFEQLSPLERSGIRSLAESASIEQLAHDMENFVNPSFDYSRAALQCRVYARTERIEFREAACVGMRSRGGGTITFLTIERSVTRDFSNQERR